MKRLSALAQLIALYRDTKGITGTGALAKLTGFGERAIWAAKAQLKEHAPLNQHAAPPEAYDSPPLHAYAAPPESGVSPDKSPSPLKERSPPAPPLKKKTPLPLPPELTSFVQAPRPQQTRGSRLPRDWVLPPDWRAWALENFCPDEAAIAAEADKFRDHWVAAAGANASKLDWAATWRNWCRRAKPETAKRRTDGATEWRPRWMVERDKAWDIALGRSPA